MNHKPDEEISLTDQRTKECDDYNNLLFIFNQLNQIIPCERKAGWLRKISELIHILVQTDLSNYLTDDLIDYIIQQLDDPNNYIYAVSIIKDMLLEKSPNSSRFINYETYEKLITTMPPKNNIVIIVCNCLIELIKYNDQIEPRIELDKELLGKFLIINSENSYNFTATICKLLFHYIVYTNAFEFYDDLIVQSFIIIEHRQNAKAVKWAARELVEIARRSKQHIADLEYMPYEMISGSDMRTNGIDPSAISILICTLIDEQISDEISRRIVDTMNWDSLEWGLTQTSPVIREAAVRIVRSLAKAHAIPDSWIFPSDLLSKLVEIATNSSSSTRMIALESIVYLSKLSHMSIKTMSELIGSASDMIAGAPIETITSFIFQLCSLLRDSPNAAAVAAVIEDSELTEALEDIGNEGVAAQLKVMKKYLEDIS